MVELNKHMKKTYSLKTKHKGRPVGWRQLEMGEMRQRGDIALEAGEDWNERYTTAYFSPITNGTKMEYFRRKAK